MVYEINDIDKVKELFKGWQETLIYSCIQKVMGKLYVTDLKNPKSVMAYVGVFTFYAGEPDEELVKNKPKGFIIMTPQNEAWGKVIEDSFPGEYKKVIRYAIKKNTRFDFDKLKRFVEELPQEYEIKLIDGDLYDECLKYGWSEDFVSSFESKEDYLKKGLGAVVLKNGNMVAGASSYTRYLEGIEIEVDTIKEERRKHLATACCAYLILECQKRGFYPSWDAQNMDSVHLAEKLGYEFAHEYTAYEVYAD